MEHTRQRRCHSEEERQWKHKGKGGVLPGHVDQQDQAHHVPNQVQGRVRVDDVPRQPVDGRVRRTLCEFRLGCCALPCSEALKIAPARHRRTPASEPLRLGQSTFSTWTEGWARAGCPLGPAHACTAAASFAVRRQVAKRIESAGRAAGAVSLLREEDALVIELCVHIMKLPPLFGHGDQHGQSRPQQAPAPHAQTRHQQDDISRMTAESIHPLGPRHPERNQLSPQLPPRAFGAHLLLRWELLEDAVESGAPF